MTTFAFWWDLIGSDTLKNLVQLSILSMFGWALRRICVVVRDMHATMAEARAAVRIMQRLSEELAYANGRTTAGQPYFEPLHEAAVQVVRNHGSNGQRKR